MSSAFEEGLTQSLSDEFFLTPLSSPIKPDRKLHQAIEISQEVLEEYLSCNESSQHNFLNQTRPSLPHSISYKRSSTSSDQIIPQDLLDAFLTFQQQQEDSNNRLNLFSSIATKTHGPVLKGSSSLVECSAGKDLDISRESEYDVSDDGLLDAFNQISPPAIKRKQNVFTSEKKRMKLRDVLRNI